MSEVGKLTVGDQEIDLPVIEGTEQERALDISKLRATTGLVTLDEGYVNTGSTTSSVTFLDGEKGILRYRGYPIEQLAAQCDFIEVAYLLIFGELPTPSEIENFRMRLRRHTMLHEDMRLFYDGFPRDAHPMAILSSVSGALSTFYQDSLNPDDSEQVNESIVRLLAKLPTIAAFAYKKSVGQPFVYPRNDLTYCENFLRMMFSVPTEEYELDPDFGAQSAAHCPRRPRAELQHVDCANGRFVERESFCFDFGRHQRPVGAVAWRSQRGLCGHARTDSPGQRERQKIRRHGQEQKRRFPPHGLWASGLQKLRSSGDHHQSFVRQVAEETKHRRPDFRHRPRVGRSGSQRRVLHRAKALSERRFLFRRHLPSDRHPDAHVYGAVFHRPVTRLDRPLERNAQQPEESNLPPTAGLHGRKRAGNCAD